MVGHGGGRSMLARTAATVLGCRGTGALARGLPLLGGRELPSWRHRRHCERWSKEEEAKKGEMDWKGSRRSITIAGGGQPSASTIAGNHDSFRTQGLVKLNGCRGIMGKRRRPRPINRHAAPKAAGCWGPGASHLPLRFSAKPSPGAPWAQGLLSVFLEWGSPDLPACGLPRGSSGGQHGPSSSAQAQDPREGPSLAGRTTGSFLWSGLARQAREEAERSRQGYLARSP